MSDMTPERLAEIDELLGQFVKMGDGSQEDAYFELLAHIDAQQRTIEQLQALIEQIDTDIRGQMKLGEFSQALYTINLWRNGQAIDNAKEA
jgi:hypothetical protein